MKYIRQFTIIMMISFAGEVMHSLLPLPIPASIYGLVLLFLLLCAGIIKLRHVKETAVFLIEIMPVMFIPAAVGLLESYGALKAMLIPFLVISVVSTVTTMVASGWVTQLVIGKKEGRKNG